MGTWGLAALPGNTLWRFAEPEAKTGRYEVNEGRSRGLKAQEADTAIRSATETGRGVSPLVLNHECRTGSTREPRECKGDFQPPSPKM